MRNLVGEYLHKLDAKNRLALPAAFRKVLPQDLIVTLSPDGDCLYVFDEDGFGDWVESLFVRDGGFDSSNKAHVRARTVLNSRAKSASQDASGRIGITSAQREAAGLGKEVEVIGNSDHFEIWDAKRWREFVDGVDLVSDIFAS